MVIAGVLANIAVTMLSKLVTERFVAHLTISLLRLAAKSTKNDVDDEMVEEAAVAFGIAPKKVKEGNAA